MLGCHDFCGYYDWTFSYFEQELGADALRHLWSEAVVLAQQNYTKAGLAKGLRGLYETWTATGEQEHCDWTFTLDEDRNVLRWDMRQCPSKGYLIDNDLYASEDYCDHCFGWIQPLLAKVRAEIVEHEHNHCGQCWAEIRLKGKPCESLAGHPGDITKDPRWDHGYADRWRGGAKLPLLRESAIDPVNVIENWFAADPSLTVLGRGPSAVDAWTAAHRTAAVIAMDPTYATRDVYVGEPRGVLIGDQSVHLDGVARRFCATPVAQRPLLMHAYLPGAAMLPFARYGLPRPVPILPLLVRRRLYRHEPNAPYPTTGVFALLVAAALDKRVVASGIDLYRHPTGQTYVNGQQHIGWPKRHSEACDAAHLRAVLGRLGERALINPHLMSLLRHDEDIDGPVKRTGLKD